MRVLIRLALWLTSGIVALVADVLTKAAPHQTQVNHWSNTPPLLLVMVGLCLCALGLCHSNLQAIAAGLMFGALCGNGGQLLLHGYVSDWIPVGHWLTNVADIAGASGLAFSFGVCLASPVWQVRRQSA